MKTTMSSLTSLFFFLGVLLHVGVAVDHKVGGEFGWNVPPNPTFFSKWASNITFFLGDRLVFESRANETHYIGEPRFQSEFDECAIKGVFIKRLNSIPLSFLGPRLFISTNETECNAGMKFSVITLPMQSSTAKVGAWPMMILFAIAISMANLLFF